MEISLFFALVFPVPVQIAQAIVRLATIFTGKQGSYNREVIILRQHKNKTKNVTMGVKISRSFKFIGQVLLEWTYKRVTTTSGVRKPTTERAKYIIKLIKKNCFEFFIVISTAT